MAVIGTNGADVLQSQGTDLIRGLGGADTLTSIYDDTLEGGAGDDLLQANSPFSTYNGWASYAAASGPVHVSLTLTGPQNVGADQGVDTLVNLHGLIGSAYNDVLSVGPNDVSSSYQASVDPEIDGGAGDDSLTSGAGMDRLSGDAGDDTIDATAAQSSVIDGGAGNDVIFANPNATTGAAFGGDGDDRIYNATTAHGGNGADTLTAGHAPGWINGAALYGEGGDDSLVGGAWADSFYGGAGHNTIVGGGGGDFINVFELGDAHSLTPIAYQNDVIQETGTGNTLSFADGPSDIHTVVDLSAGTAHVDEVSGGVTRRIADLTFNNIQTVWPSAGDDSILGSAGDDTLRGGDGTNTLFGGDGNDSIIGGSGHNQVNGNKGADTIVGESSVGDWLLGGQGDDSISGGGAADIINGNMGNDTLSASAYASSGSTLRGGQGDDVIGGGGRGDLIFGDLGHNTLTGGLGADTFVGGAGHDVVTDFKASEGDHVLIGSGVTWQASQSGADVSIVLSNGGDLLLRNVQLNSLSTGWIGAG